jgi:solute carrier family 8 (sodium/calcium exchanger)
VGVVGNGFESEALGPGTIVGSAAFNLLGISAVCIAGIPSGETRRYLLTLVFNIY